MAILMTDYKPESTSELDSLTRSKLKYHDSAEGFSNINPNSDILLALVLGGIIGFIGGLISSSLLHKYIVHPLGF